MEKIFVSIASYRDPQTAYTIKDLIAKAKNKKSIIIGVCLQHEKNEIILPKYDNLKILEYNWRESQGTCWARHNIQKFLYEDENYYFQLDSHHRFCENWDSILIDTTKKLKEKYDKPIIGGYCPAYKPDKDSDLENRPMKISCFPDFSTSGDLMFVPRVINNHESINNKESVIPARFLSGHFIFAENSFCYDCLYDPNLYFRGEELTLSARAYTHGYDMFHPTQSIVWHEYIRKKQIKHWDDHTRKNGFVTDSNKRADLAKERARYLLGIEKNNKIKFGRYGLGNKRQLHEYELYCGLSFSTKQVHNHAYDVNNIYPPPRILSEEEWESGLMRKYKVSCNIDKKFVLLLNERLDIDYVTVSFRDINNTLCYNQKIKRPNLASIQEKYYLESSMENTPIAGIFSAYNESNSLIQQSKMTAVKLHE